MPRAPFTAIDADAGPIDPAIVARAADWMARLGGEASTADHEQCRSWRAEHPQHERAWRRLNALSEDLSGVANVTPRAAAAALNGAADGQARRRVLKGLLGIGGVGIIGATAADQLPWQRWAAAHRTTVGEQRLVTLDDGTTVLLNTASAVDVLYDAGERLIRLHDGEILVTTGHDAAGRPLRILTDAGAITPVGTRFTVRRLGGDTTAVTVLQGAVRLSPADADGSGVTLAAGERTTFTATSVAASESAARDASAWTDGMLVASRMRLDAFIAELSRYRRGVLRCEADVAAQLVTGAFPLHDTDRVLAMLEQVLPVRVHRRTAYWVSVGQR